MFSPRKLLINSAIVVALPAIVVDAALAVEEAEYALVKKVDNIEIRDYAPQIVAEVVVQDDFKSAGNEAFRPLFNYIDGKNRGQQKIEMTAPVSQEAASTTAGSQEIAMTAPVGQSATDEGWAVSFMMPSEFTWETIPQPLDPKVKLRQVPAHRAAVIRYSGTWSQQRYAEHLEELIAWLNENDYRVDGEPTWARYNAPFIPWFLRRNEIIVPIES